MDSTITVRDLCREFRTVKRQPGFLGSIRTLFTRQYNVVRAVDHVTFSIERGELVGYIGPNGAGKSTTIKMLTGVLVPTSGHVETNDLVPHKHRQELAGRIGAVFGQRSQLWWDLPLGESFRILKEVYRVPDETYERNMRAFNELVGLDELLNTPVRQLSLGQRMRGEMVAALLHDPEIVFLDEPMLGLDVVARERMRQFIAEINRERGVTVIWPPTTWPTWSGCASGSSSLTRAGCSTMARSRSSSAATPPTARWSSTLGGTMPKSGLRARNWCGGIRGAPGCISPAR